MFSFLPNYSHKKEKVQPGIQRFSYSRQLPLSLGSEKNNRLFMFMSSMLLSLSFSDSCGVRQDTDKSAKRASCPAKTQRHRWLEPTVRFQPSCPLDFLMLASDPVLNPICPFRFHACLWRSCCSVSQYIYWAFIVPDSGTKDAVPLFCTNPASLHP